MSKKELVCDCDVIHLDLVKKIESIILKEKEIDLVAKFYKAFSDNTRVKIINLLQNSNMCVCDISYLLNMTKSAVSHQLKYLKEMNLIKCERKGKEIWYELADEHVLKVFELSLEHIWEGKDEK